MGAKLTTCTDAPKDFTKSADFTTPIVILPSGTSPPNFMKKIALTCSYPPSSSNDPKPPMAYSAAIQYDWGVVVPIGMAILLIIIMIGYLVMKMRHHPASIMAPSMVQD